jgi:hydrogenase maturation protease
MNIEQVKEIANAVLYEGYLLYPYRHSAIKNRQRWTFGVLYPQEYSEANGGIEPWTMHTECLIAGHAETSLDMYVRFLHLLQRTQGNHEDSATAGAYPRGRPEHWTPETWEEGVEREVNALDLALGDLVAHPLLIAIDFPGRRMIEQPTGPAATAIVREQQSLTGIIKLMAEQVDSRHYKLAVHIENRTALSGVEEKQRDAVLLESFVSTHTILQARRGTFISSLDPPEDIWTITQECQNIRTWPVLVGNEGECDTVLSSPIILYDYPQIAPESVGSLFDATEIDEILTLRIMTLTDEEKREIRQGDELARQLLEHIESLSPEQLMQLHGTIRSLKPVSKGGDA